MKQLKHHKLVPKGHTCRDCGGVFPEAQFSVAINEHYNGNTYINVNKLCSKCKHDKYYDSRKPQVKFVPKAERRISISERIAEYFKEKVYEVHGK